jgi:hypothetical protein
MLKTGKYLIMQKEKTILKSVLFVGVAIALLSFDLPTGWFSAGSNPANYDMGIDKGAGQDGKNCAATC